MWVVVWVFLTEERRQYIRRRRRSSSRKMTRGINKVMYTHAQKRELLRALSSRYLGLLNQRHPVKVGVLDKSARYVNVPRQTASRWMKTSKYCEYLEGGVTCPICQAAVTLPPACSDIGKGLRKHRCGGDSSGNKKQLEDMDEPTATQSTNLHSRRKEGGRRRGGGGAASSGRISSEPGFSATTAAKVMMMAYQWNTYSNEEKRPVLQAYERCLKQKQQEKQDVAVQLAAQQAGAHADLLKLGLNLHDMKTGEITSDLVIWCAAQLQTYGTRCLDTIQARLDADAYAKVARTSAMPAGSALPLLNALANSSSSAGRSV